MDKRLTLATHESFLKTLQKAYQSGEMVYLLIDDHGISRVEGCIKKFYNDALDPCFEMDNGLKIAAKSVVALNGVFLSEFGEC